MYLKLINNPIVFPSFLYGMSNDSAEYEISFTKFNFFTFKHD